MDSSGRVPLCNIDGGKWKVRLGEDFPQELMPKPHLKVGFSKQQEYDEAAHQQWFGKCLTSSGHS